MESKEYLLITGASSGIGQHIALQLSEKYHLVLNGRNSQSLEKVREQCSNNSQHLIWEHDLKDLEGIEEGIKALVLGNKITISGFIHCAGYLKMVPLRSLTLSQFQDTMHINFNSAVLIIKSLISRKINASALSKVVFISSTASIMGAKAFNVYSGSKAALDGLMRSLAVELAPQVRLNSVLPGGIQTKMTEVMFQDQQLLGKMAKDYPLGLGEPNDIYEMVDFLVSNKSKWITGQQFVVDGGRSINISA